MTLQREMIVTSYDNLTYTTWFWNFDAEHKTSLTQGMRRKALSIPDRERLFFILGFIVSLCLTRTGNYRVHEFDWLKSILPAVYIFPSRSASRPVIFCGEKVAQ